MRSYASQLRTGHVPIEHLIIEKLLSKMPWEYRNLVPQAVAAKHLVREGGEVHAGQTLTYVFTRNRSRVSDNRALPAELVDGTTPYDAERYVELLASSVVNLLSPLGYGLERLVGATQ